MRSSFIYEIKDDVLSIVDLDKGTSVTNNAENILTHIRYKEGIQVESLKVIYRDSDGNWDTMIPE